MYIVVFSSCIVPAFMFALEFHALFTSFKTDAIILCYFVINRVCLLPTSPLWPEFSKFVNESKTFFSFQSNSDPTGYLIAKREYMFLLAGNIMPGAEKL